MKIERNREVAAFLRRCRKNLENDYINDYIGVIIESKADERAIRGELKSLGYVTDSLYLSSDEYCKSPYNSVVHLEGVKDGGFEYRAFDMPADELINVDVIQDDPKRELNDFLILKAFDKGFKAASLFQDGEFWMSDNPAEARTINPYAAKAHGRVLTFGLGIGYFIFMALRNPAVESVTVVEYNRPVIEMFKKYLMPYFGDKKIEIIEGDAFAYFNEAFLSGFDYVFADIWKDHRDGLDIIERMLEQYCPAFEKVDFWIERTCYEIVMAMMFEYFDNLSLGKELPDGELYQKFDIYFGKIGQTVSDPEVLKDYMYSREVIRNILAIEV